MTSGVTKRAEDRYNYRVPMFFYNSAREAFADLLANTAGPNGSHGVLLPGYIGWSAAEGSGVFDPVAEAHVPYGFYSVHRDLSVDLEGFEDELSSGRYGFAVVIHYFGRTQRDLLSVRELTNKYRVALVEDLAHAFFTHGRHPLAGRVGDVSLFSIHKQLPTASGGMVAYNDSNLIAGQMSSRPELATEILAYNWRGIADARRRNYQRAVEALTGIIDRRGGLDLLWPLVGEFDVPQSLPLVVREVDRDWLYHHMNTRGFGFVSLYHTLIGEVTGMFPHLHDLSASITNVPIHQDVAEDQFEAMFEELEHALC
jgi:dTDP-4-amino-4,6-dideoxygalactose transaminase